MTGAPPIEETREQLLSAFERWEQRPDLVEHRFERIVVPAPEVHVADWLAAQPHAEQVLWKSKGEQRWVAGVGTADLVVGGDESGFVPILERCRKYTADQPNARYYGGFAFDATSAEDPGWYRFGPARFVLPRFEYDGQNLCCNLLFRSDNELQPAGVLAQLADLVFPSAPSDPKLPTIVDRTDFPDEQGWSGNVLTALEMIEQDVLEKIVLARRADYRFAEPTSAARILAKLSRVTRNCFHFLLQPDHAAAFMGTTPERLFEQTAGAFKSEVIAGTRSRSEDPVEDRALSDGLLNSEKDQREHDIVRKAMRQKLHLLCDQLDVQDEAELLLLERKQHLISKISGQLSEGKSDADLLGSLHPTPAVGGYPRENALREIRRLEPFCRGWYAAPVGWVGRDSSEFAVAIRSGLVQGATVSVYSGAGIVQGSEPSEEWLEIENKISDFVKVTQ